ncbi:tol-pal system protein YbgF [uncultured Alsobacter sp.]|uniref:tol-pal system protein YbgF n=1 Tax=uncultured Alsobacter sp. TaxID=1748258 RepID=UPI0025E047C4|nr:tol-pal system protein YbgF [uncultured Alsobacter sp.]
MYKRQEDVEFRFQEMKGGARPTAGGATPTVQPARPAPSAPAPGPAPQKRGDAFDPASQPNAPGAPRTLGNVPGDVTAGIPAARGVPMDGIFADDDGEAGPLDLSTRARPGTAAGGVGLSPPGLPTGSLPSGSLPSGALPGPTVLAPSAQAMPQPAMPQAAAPRTGAPAVMGTAPTPVAAPGTGSAKEDYDMAYGLLQQKQYEQAEMAFRQYLQTWPRDRLVPNATYWLAETYYRRQRYPDAVEQYLKVYKSHGQSRVAPESLYKLALSLRGMGQPEQSCATLAEVLRKYPDSSNDLRAGVEREQKRGNC